MGIYITILPTICALPWAGVDTAVICNAWPSGSLSLASTSISVPVELAATTKLSATAIGVRSRYWRVPTVVIVVGTPCRDR